MNLCNISINIIPIIHQRHKDNTTHVYCLVACKHDVCVCVCDDSPVRQEKLCNKSAKNHLVIQPGRLKYEQQQRRGWGLFVRKYRPLHIPFKSCSSMKERALDALVCSVFTSASSPLVRFPFERRQRKARVGAPLHRHVSPCCEATRA